MATPITGPVVEFNQVGSLGLCSSYGVKTRYRQRHPYDIVLPYEHRSASASLSREGVETSGFDAYNACNPLWVDILDFREADSKCYDKLKDRLYDTASWVPNIAERQQAYKMIGDTARTLITAVKQVKKFQFSAAAKTLRMKFVPRGASPRKIFANNWLEFHFGWEPLIKDIYSTVDLLQQPLKTVTVRASKTIPQGEVLLAADQDYNVPPDGSGGAYFIRFRRRMAYATITASGCQVSVTNPNLHLADQMGLVNPLSVAWEVVPFSFVVDWFANVGQVVGSMTDFLGLTIKNGWTTRMAKMYSYQRRLVLNSYFKPSPPPGEWSYWTVRDDSDITHFHMKRSSGLVSPVLYVRPLYLPGLKRAATMLAVLSQQLK